MLLSTVFSQLNFGELSHRSFGNDITGEIGREHYPSIITAINLAMDELHKRFPILSKKLNIQGYEDITTYTLTSQFAESNVDSLELIKYILDTDKPFTDDVLLVNRVYSIDSSDISTEYSLNIDNDRRSLSTLNDKVLSIPYPNKDVIYILDYRAKAKPIDYREVYDPSAVELALPTQYLEALLNYTSYRIHSGLKNDSSATEATTYYAKFESACRLLLNYGLHQPIINNIERFDNNGWV